MDQEEYRVVVNGFLVFITFIFGFTTFVFVLLGMPGAALACGIIACIAALCACSKRRIVANRITSAEAQLLQRHHQNYPQSAYQGNHHSLTDYGTYNRYSTLGFSRGPTTVGPSMSLVTPSMVSQASRSSTYDDPPPYSSLDPPDESWLNPLRIPSHRDLPLRDANPSDPPSYEAATSPRDVTNGSLVE